MAVRANRGSTSRRILLPRTVNPTTARWRARSPAIRAWNSRAVDFDRARGGTPLEALEAHGGEDFAALVVQQPNFFGNLEEVDALTDWAHANNVLLIAVVNPISLALLKPPGEWGELGRQRAPTSSAARASRSACRSPPADLTSASWRRACSTCGRCRAASWDARSIPRGAPASRSRCRRASSTSAAARRRPTSAPIKASR